MPPVIDLLCLSPHFDDAVLSCGGQLHRAARSGRLVLVVTVCAAPPSNGDLSGYAARLHRRWAAAGGIDASGMVARRRVEDAVALRRLGVTGACLDLPDAIYRRDPRRGDWLYATHAALFGDVSHAEAPLVAALADRLARVPGAARAGRVLAPLAVGGHVDHRLVRRAAEAAWSIDRLRFYADYPYAENDAALAAALAADADGRWLERRVPLTDDDVAAKIAAVAAYASQISTFWADEAAMADAIRHDAHRAGRGSRAAERVWRRGAAAQTPAGDESPARRRARPPSGSRRRAAAT